MKYSTAPILFVGGIDTNVGKTYATAFLAKYLVARGLRTITQKIIQTGCVGSSEDIEMHRHLLRQPYLTEDEEHLTCPYIFSYPASPHLAAKIDGCKIDLQHIDKCTQLLLDKGYDMVLLEGSGGLMVPIHHRYMTLDFIADRHYPLALVTSGRLGSINHTLMSTELCRLRGIELQYLIYNEYPSTDQIIGEDTYNYLRDYLTEFFPRCELLRMPFLE